MGQSERHHYIPQFLIRNFANDKSMLHVYNKDSGKIKEMAPKSVFFEWNRNTLKFVGGKANDKMESIYAVLDSMMAEPVNKVISEFKMNSQSLRFIILLATLMKWRVPGSDESFNAIKDKVSFEELGLKLSPICNQYEATSEMIAESMDMENYNEMKRILMPTFLFSDQTYYEEVQKGCFVIEGGCPNLLGDCGCIEDMPVEYRKLGNILMPIGSDCTFVFKQGALRTGIKNQELFFDIKNMLTFRMSKKYVACQSKKGLEKYIDLEKEQGQYSTEDLMKQAFELII